MNRDNKKESVVLMLYTITIRATSILIHPGEEAGKLLHPLLNRFHYEDEFEETSHILGYIYEPGTDILYLNKGIDIDYVRRLLGQTEIRFHEYDDYEDMKFEWEEIVPPRDDEQVDIIDFISGNGTQDTLKFEQIFVTADPGAGKLEPYSRKIPTPTTQGWTYMGDLILGDYVFNRKGNPVKVTNIFEHGIQDIYKITFEDSRIALCGLEHLWCVSQYNTHYSPLCYYSNTTEQLIESLNNNIKLWIPRYANECNDKNNGCLMISSIEEYELQEQCRCITVDDQEHLYLTEGFIVTHNTFMTGYGGGQLGMKTLIIMHRDSLREQWFESLVTMNGYPKKRIHEITDGNEINQIINGDLVLDYDVYLMTHATFRAALRRINNLQEMGKLTTNLKIGFKVIDEAHLEFRNTLIVDMCFNVKRNLYLTGTAGRSNKDENIIFKYVFSNAEFYKRSDTTIKKWVEYYAIQLNTNVPRNIYRYRIISGRGMNPAGYGKWVIKRDKKQTHFNVCLELVKKEFNEYDKSKILIFMPLIELCTDLQHFLNTKLSMDESFDYELIIGTINSRNTKSDNERNKKADIIITTIASCGTGTDIPGITTLINCSPFNSAITSNQVFGRLRYCGRICRYYDTIDESVPMDYIWWKNRSKAVEVRMLSAQYLTWDNE